MQTIKRKQNLKPAEDWTGVFIMSPQENEVLFEIFFGIDKDGDFDGRIIGTDLDEATLGRIVKMVVDEFEPSHVLYDVMELMRGKSGLPSWISQQIWNEVEREKIRKTGF